MKKKVQTIILWIAVFFVSYATLSAVGFVPLEITEVNSRIIDVFSSRVDAITQEQDSVLVQDDTNSSLTRFSELVLPERIVIEKINVDSQILNPQTRDISVLDEALLEGVVRYPGSGGLDDKSNMFLFGHSTSFRTVRNPAFQAFNRLDELRIGDSISVQSGGRDYIYRVISVSQVDKDRALVEFSSGERLLTLSTCDTFGERNDRFVVTARFVEELPADVSLR